MTAAIARNGRLGSTGRRPIGDTHSNTGHVERMNMKSSVDGSVLRARAPCKQYGKGEGLVRAVDGADLDVARGETAPVMGPSGCGKSTLLHLLGGLDRPTEGELWLAGQRIDQIGERALARLRRHGIGFVFPAFHLMDELTAAELSEDGKATKYFELVPFEVRITAETVIRALAEDDGKDALHMEESDQ